MSDEVLIDTTNADAADHPSHDARVRADGAATAPAGDPAEAATTIDSTPTPTPTGRPRVRRIAGEYAGLSAAVAMVVAIMVRPWVGGWSSPIVYGNDTLSHLAMLHGAGITGTARGTSSLGAPYGLSWVDFPLGPDRVHLILFRLLHLVARDEFLALNLYLLAGFFLVAWTSYAVLRALRITPLVAGAVSVVFTIAPYHFARLADGHVFLAAYFAVPLGVLLALWASDDTIVWRAARGRLAVVVVCVLVVGSSSAYYAVFSVTLIAALGLVLAVRRGSWRVLVVPMVVAAAIIGVVGANAAGDVWSNHSSGTNNEVSVRPTSDSATFGLSLSQLVLPDPDHRVPPLAQLGRDAATNMGRGEPGSAIGLLAVLGLLAIAVTCIRSFPTARRREEGPGRSTDLSGADLPGTDLPGADLPGTDLPGADAPGADPAGADVPGTSRDPLMLRLGVMVLAAAGVAAIGSVSLLVALLGFGQIRVWSRMSIVIAYLGLVGLAVVLDRLVASPTVRGRPLGPVLVAIAVVAVAVLDQTSPGSLPDRAAVAADRRVDEQVAGQMIAALPSRAQVFELPQTDFLFTIPEGQLPLYGLLGPWAADPDALEYSAGGMQGRGGDWQRSWTTQPVDRMLPGIAAAGFDAVYLDRRSETAGDPTGGTAPASAWLREVLGTPSGVVPDGDTSREWYDLRPLRAQLVERLGAARVAQLGAAVRRPIGIDYDGAVDRFAVGDGARLLLADSRITLRDESAGAGSAAPVRVRFELTGAEGSTVRILAGGRAEDVVLGDGPTPVELDLAVEGRDTVIELHTDAPRLSAMSQRLGDVRLQVSQLQVVDASLDDALAAGDLTVGPAPEGP